MTDLQASSIPTNIQLSVIVPVYNCEEYLDKCLHSILVQKIKGAMEVICVNDGSTDKSEDIIKKYVELDSRVTLITQINRGRSAARNRGLSIARGEYIAFVDADDILGVENELNTAIFSAMINQMNKDVDLVFADISLVYETNQSKMLTDKKYYSIPFVGLKKVDSDIIRRINCSPCAKIFKKEIINRYQLRFPEKLNFEDAYWYYCYISVSKYCFGLDLKAYSYYRHASGVMNELFNEKKTELAEQHIDIVGKIYEFYDQNKLSNLFLEMLQELMQVYFQLALTGSKREDQFYIMWKMGNILRNYQVPVEEGTILYFLKSGDPEAFDVSPNVYEDARRWGRLRFYINKILPMGSMRRHVCTSILVALLELRTTIIGVKNKF